jgi:hypothetical protein
MFIAANHWTTFLNKQKQTPWLESASELYRLSDCRLSAKLVPTLVDRGRRVVSATNPHARYFRFSRPVLNQIDTVKRVVTISMSLNTTFHEILSIRVQLFNCINKLKSYPLITEVTAIQVYTALPVTSRGGP